MEMLQLLEQCNKRELTFNQAFYKLGTTKLAKPLQEMSDEETFATLANWIIHKMPCFHSTDLRLRVNGTIYQAAVYKKAKGIRVGKPEVKANIAGSMLYKWEATMTYDKLDVGELTKSIIQADEANQENARRRCFVNTAKIPELLNPTEETTEPESQPAAEEVQQLQVEAALVPEVIVPAHISLVQTERNCWEVVLSPDERELLGELLDI